MVDCLQTDQDFHLMFPDSDTKLIEAWTGTLRSRIVNLARSIQGNLTVGQLITTVEQGPSNESEIRGTFTCIKELR